MKIWSKVGSLTALLFLSVSNAVGQPLNQSLNASTIDFTDAVRAVTAPESFDRAMVIWKEMGVEIGIVAFLSWAVMFLVFGASRRWSDDDVVAALFIGFAFALIAVVAFPFLLMYL